jgi:putative nucleotidyltransferase with HDIG domain/PAS domain S-box-containing protein
MIRASDDSVLDNLLEGCQIIGFDYRYLYVNDAVAKQGRKPKEELLGHTMMELYPGIEATHMFSLIEQCMKERTPAELENEFTFPDGSIGWFALKIEPVPQGAFILSIDISERKRAEIEIQNQLRRIQALREIDMAIISTTNLSLSLKTVLEKVTDSLHVDAADILLISSHTQMLEFAAGRGFQTHGIELTQLRVGQGHAGGAALEQRTIFIPDLRDTQEPFLRAALIARENFVSFYCVPLIAKGNVVGVLEVFHRSPLDPDQTWLDFLHALAGQASIAIDSGHLFHDLQRRNVDLVLAYDSTIEGWSKALDLRDKETEGHTLRVTEMTIKLARAAGIPEAEIIHVKRGALLHDIGKMGVPDTILHKPGKLTDDEWDIMRQHPAYAYDMLYSIEYLRPALSIPYSHHEKWDGTGYPQGLKGEQIPLSARLFSIVDVWDALRSNRPYRQSWPDEKVHEYIRSEAGAYFDSKAVELFLHVINGKTQASR